MKVTTETPKPEFTPRSITITFESQAELDALTCILVWEPNCTASKKTFGANLFPIGMELKRIGGNDVTKWPEFRMNTNRP